MTPLLIGLLFFHGLLSRQQAVFFFFEFRRLPIGIFDLILLKKCIFVHFFLIFLAYFRYFHYLCSGFAAVKRMRFVCDLYVIRMLVG